MVTDAIFTEQNGLKHKVRGINFKKKNKPTTNCCHSFAYI